MFVTVSSQKLQLRPGAIAQFPGTWSEYQTLTAQRGEQAIPRIKYCHGEILLMSPLPKHGRSASLLAGIVRAILESRTQNYEAFTPMTIELPTVGGIEPDYCFYIDNWQAAVGKDRINWSTDPPPDLAIEIDVTNYTNIDDYLPYRIPEVWLLRGDRLHLYSLTQNQYISVDRSQYFPDLDITSIVTECLSAASTQGTGIAMQQLKRKLEQAK